MEFYVKSTFESADDRAQRLVEEGISEYVADLEEKIKECEVTLTKCRKRLAKVRQDCKHRKVFKEAVEDVFGEYSGTICTCEVCGKVDLIFDHEYYEGKYEEEL